MVEPWIFPLSFNRGVSDTRQILYFPTISRSMWILNHCGRLDILALFTLNGSQNVFDVTNCVSHLVDSCQLSRQPLQYPARNYKDLQKFWGGMIMISRQGFLINGFHHHEILVAVKPEAIWSNMHK